MTAASIRLALHDAATNCVRDGATARVILRGSAELVGTLQPVSGADMGTRHLHNARGGWATFEVAEVAAVETYR